MDNKFILDFSYFQNSNTFETGLHLLTVNRIHNGISKTSALRNNLLQFQIFSQ